MEQSMCQQNIKNADYTIIGAGIMGLTIAYELSKRHPNALITILEKESDIGRHASGRNSGVLHSGIYYKKGALKAQLCATGAKAMAAYCDANNLPIKRVGKVVVPLKSDDDKQLAVLLERAKHNQAKAELVDAKQLKELEPNAYSLTGKALFVPETSVIDSKVVLAHLFKTLSAKKNVSIHFNTFVNDIDIKKKIIKSAKQDFHYGFLFNTAGMYADKIAKQFGLGEDYTILPFKGIYYRLKPSSHLNIKRLIYPVPDMNMPFLGVHFTTKVDGTVYVGPTAVPALGRENYKGIKGMKLNETSRMLYHLTNLYRKNANGFRQFTHAEALRFFKSKFIQGAQALVPAVTVNDLATSDKVGLRSQLLNIKTNQLEMDFLLAYRDDSVHVLNAVSPAFTSSFAFSAYILDEIQH